MKRLILALGVIAALVTLIAWSQPWLTLHGVLISGSETSEELRGDAAAPALLPIGLASLVLLLVMLTLRARGARILGGVLMLLGAASLGHSVTSYDRAVVVGQEQMTAHGTQLASQFESLDAVSADVTFMWIVAAIGSVLLMAAGILALITAPSWAGASTRFEQRPARTSVTEAADEPRANRNISQWDQLSQGADPTDDVDH